MKKISKLFILLLVVGLLFAVAPTGQAKAADTAVACTGTGDTAQLQGAIDSAAAGDVITVSGTCVLESVVNVNKAVTLQAASDAKIQVSGTGDRFDISAAATLTGFKIQKTDKTAPQDIIRIRASGINITNNEIWGEWIVGDGEVTRAMVMNAGAFTDILISGNTIHHLRQPLYISGTNTGTISNNFVHDTKGFVVEGGNMTFTGNTWANNVGDIAILIQVPSTYYTDIVALSNANNGAVVEDQRLSTPLLTVAYVDDSAAAGGNGTQAAPYQTIQAGITRVIAGGTVNVAAGIYDVPTTITLDKAISIIGPTTGEAKVIGAGGTTNKVFNINSSDVTIQNLTLTLTAPSSTGDAIIFVTEGYPAPGAPKTNINILNNEIYVAPQAGAMSTWKAQAIYIGRQTTASKVNGNTIYNTRSGLVVAYNSALEIKDNVIYNTKGGIMNYTGTVADADNRVMTGNSWGTTHNEWDIVWNSGGGPYVMDMDKYVLQLSIAQSDARVVSQMTTGVLAELTGNRSHVFVNATTGTTTIKADNGNINVPYAKIQDGINAVVPGGTVNVAAGVYNENLTINKALTLQGAGDDAVTVNGVAPTTDAGMLNIVASDVTIDGFKFVGQGLKTVRLNAPSTNVTFSNNTVIGAEYDGVGAWDLFTSNYNNAHSNLTITGNVFENHGGQIGVYLNPQVTGLTFTGNTFQGDPTSGPVLGIDGMLGTEVITGNTFNIGSSYALFEGFGTVPIVDIFDANTWPAGYIASGKMVVPASVVYPSTNDINRTNGWAHVDFVSADATAKTITLEFFPNPVLGHFVSCFERRSDGDTSQILTENGGVNYNPLILDGLYPYSCYYGDSGTTYLRTIPVLDYVEIRLPFGAESDERFYWAKFELIDQVWVDDDFTSTTPGWGVDHFAVIQDGIEAVAAGGTVNVAAGTYNEGILLNKPNVTVKATDGAQTTFINTPAGTLTVGVQVLANMGTVTFDGFTVQNFTESGIVQGMASAVGTTFHVKNNVVTPAAGYLRNGIQVSGDGSTVIGNTVNGAPLTDSWASSGILAVNGSNILIEGNTILGGTLGLDIGIGVQSWSVNAANVIVRNNNISGANNGIRLEGSATTRTLTDVLIESNTIDGSMRAINTQWVTLVDIDAQLNKFLNTTGEVLRISTSSALGSMDASHNWFGNALGPQNPIIGDIQVIKWCADEGCTTFLPNDNGDVPIIGDPFTQTGAIKLYVDGVNYYLPAGTTIQNSSPCFEVYADNIKIYTDYPAAAKCVPTNGSDGIWVADGVESLRVVGLEFDGTGQTTGDGIHFAGVVTNFQIIENYFHDLGGDAIEFVGAPAGTIQDVYGNYFVGANSITLGAGTLNAAYNSWGTYAAPTAPTGVTVAPHTHAEIYVTPAIGGEILKDTQVVFTVNGKIQSLTGAEFELSYPEQLELVSAVANDTTWDQYALVDTSVAGKITVALSAYNAVSGDPVEMLTLTFKALAYADDLTLTFSDTADVFSMYPLPEPNYSNYVYTFAQTGVTNLDIIGLPLVTITMDPAPYYAGIPIPFEVEVDNTNGGTYTGLTFDITLPALSVLEYFDGTDWVAATLPFTVGSLAPDQILTFAFRVTLDQPGDNTIAIDLMNGTESIGSDSVTITIAGNFNVLGTFAMQGRTVRDDIPVTFTLGSYGPTFMSVDQLLNNLSGTLQYGGTYLITTNQARYLNVTADLLKDIEVLADVTLPSLTLRAGNAVWTGHATSNNQIDLADANQIGTDWGKPGSDSLIINYGDVNFDGIVNIRDLALVGGNYTLTNTGAYGTTWLP